MNSIYNRYSIFTEDGNVGFVPFVEIKKLPRDKYIIYNSNKHRMDRLSSEFYGDPNYGWLIMLANPSIGSLEFNIEDGTRIRIPYPLNDAIQAYNDGVDNYNLLY